ncbi:MAG: hypothetical protein COT74_00115 [Bdellovibrionales bacterium CG10_big_fil_rev_8_21_14_0_10_45_34]|nr:MAG: hypothetical protein COT74_00115 [Bdellovibrionales bacterium CG10_big_fil_rev_8_21_14_0_10_45_34]
MSRACTLNSETKECKAFLSFLILTLAFAVSGCGVLTEELSSTSTDVLNPVFDPDGDGADPTPTPTPEVIEKTYLGVVGNTADGGFTLFEVNTSNGSLEQKAEDTAVGAYANYVVASPDGKNVYTSNMTGSVTKIDVNAETGATSKSSVTVGSSNRTMSVHPSGKFVFVGESLNPTSKIHALSRDLSSGDLAPVGTINTYVRLRGRMSFGLDGGVLFAPNWQSPSISQLAVSLTTGVLTGLTPDAVPTGESRTLDTVVSPDGKHLYTPNDWNNRIRGFDIDPTTGALAAMVTPSFTMTGLAAIISMAMTPNGKCIFGGGWGSGKVFAASRNATTGELTYLDVTTYETAISQTEIDSSGKFMYVSRYASTNNLYGFAIDQEACTYTLLDGFPKTIAYGALNSLIIFNASYEEQAE